MSVAHPEKARLVIAMMVLTLFGAVMFAVIKVITSETMLGIMLGALSQSVGTIVGSYFRSERDERHYPDQSRGGAGPQ